MPLGTNPFRRGTQEEEEEQNTLAPPPPSGGGALGPNPFRTSTPQPTAQPRTLGQNVLDAGIGLVTTVGRALQPLAAPQQILFGTVGALSDLVTGQGAAAAWKTFSRAGAAAASYATYGAIQFDPDQSDGQQDPRDNAVSGYDLLKKFSAPDWVAVPTGLALDFFADVPLVGQIGKVRYLTKVEQNLAKTWSDPGALRDFAKLVARAPMHTAPLKQFIAAIPAGEATQVKTVAGKALHGSATITTYGKQASPAAITAAANVSKQVTIAERPGRGTRTKMAEDLGSWIEQTRFRAHDKSRQNVVGPSISEIANSRFGTVSGVGEVNIAASKAGLPTYGAGISRKLQEGIFKVQTLGANLMIRAMDTSAQYNKAVKLVDEGTLDTVNKQFKKMFDLEDYSKMETEVRSLQRILAPFPGAYDAFMAAAESSVKLDTYRARLMNQARIMQRDELEGFLEGEAFFNQLRTGQRSSRTVKPDTIRDTISKLAPIVPDVDEQDAILHVAHGRKGFHVLQGYTKDDLKKINAATPNNVGYQILRDHGGVVDAVLISSVGTKRIGGRNLKQAVTSIRNDPFSPEAMAWQNRLTGASEDAISVGFDAMTQGQQTDWYLSGVWNPRGRWSEHAISPYYTLVDQSDSLELRFAKDFQNFIGGVRAGADPFAPPDTSAAWHYRRMWTWFDNPKAAADRIVASAPAKVEFDDERLDRTLRDWMRDTVQTGQFDEARVVQVRDQIKAAYAQEMSTTTPGAPLKRPNVLLSEYFADQVKQGNFHADEVVDIMARIGNEWHQNGIKYKPVGLEIKNEIQKWADDRKPNLGGGGRLEMASSKKGVQRRSDLPDYWIEGLGEVEDFNEILVENSKVVSKIVSRRMQVQQIYDFLKNNDGIVKEIHLADGRNLQGWRRVGTEMAARLHGIDDLGVGTPWTGTEYIPETYHRLLSTVIDVQDENVTGAMVRWGLAKWKQRKLASPAAMVRDLATNFILAEQAGINPKEFIEGYRDALKLIKQARKSGDGIYDESLNIAGITPKELYEHGIFMHASMFAKEVTEQLDEAERILMGAEGSPLASVAQAMLAATKNLQEFGPSIGGTKVIPAAIDAMGFGGPITSKFSDIKGVADSYSRSAIYIALRKKGMGEEVARRVAEDMMFSYENVPLAVDWLRKTGFSPFAAFQFFAAGRFVRTLYENPYSVIKYYKAPNALTEADPEAEKAYYAAPDYIKNTLYVPLGKDSKGQTRFVNLAAFLPETNFFSYFDSDSITQVEPPAVGIYRQIISGQGYKGTPTYQGGGSLAETASVNPQEAARGILKSLWQFGAVPWAPGQRMTERIADTIAQRAIPLEMVESKAAQSFLKFLSEGPVAAPLQSADQGLQKAGTPGSLDPIDHFLRFSGIVTAQSQPDLGEPGSARYKIEALEAQVQLLDTQMNEELKSVITRERRQEIQAKYKALRDPIIAKIQALPKRLRE